MDVYEKGRRHVRYSKLYLKALARRWLNIFVGIAWSQVFWLALEGLVGNASSHAPIRLSGVFGYAFSLDVGANLLLYSYRESEALDFLCELTTDVVGFAWINVAEELLSQVFGRTASTAATYVALAVSIALASLVAGAAVREWLAWHMSFEGTAHEFAAGCAAIPTSWLITQTVHIALYGFFYRSSPRGRSEQGHDDHSEVIRLSSSLLILAYAFLCSFVAAHLLTGTVGGGSQDLLVTVQGGVPFNSTAVEEEEGGEVDREVESSFYSHHSDQRRDSSHVGHGDGHALLPRVPQPQAEAGRGGVAAHSTSVARFGGIGRGALLYAQLTAGMMVGWAYNLWGQVEFRQEELEFRFGPMLGAAIYAVTCTALGVFVMVNGAEQLDQGSGAGAGAGGGVIPGCAFEASRVTLHRRRLLVTVGGVSLMVGWAWEETFDLLLESALGEEVGVGIFLAKLGLATVATAIALGKEARNHSQSDSRGSSWGADMGFGLEGRGAGLLDPLIHDSEEEDRR